MNFQLLCLNHLSLEDIQAAILSLQPQDPQRTLCIALNLFAPKPESLMEHNLTGVLQKLPVCGRMELELEPIFVTSTVSEQSKLY